MFSFPRFKLYIISQTKSKVILKPINKNFKSVPNTVITACFDPSFCIMSTILNLEDKLLPNKVQTLKNLCQNNAEYFANDFSKNGRKLCKYSLEISVNLDNLAEKMTIIEAEAPRFDLDESTPASGYRSYVKVGKSALDYGINLAQKIVAKRTNVMFPKNKLAEYSNKLNEKMYL